MIQPMKQIVLLCLEQDHKTALAHLADLSVVHLSVLPNAESPDIASLKKTAADIQLAQSMLSDLPENGKKYTGNASSALAKINVILEDRVLFNKELDQLNRQAEDLEPWGDFSLESLNNLAESGIYSMLAVVSEEQLETIPEDVTYQVIGTQGSLQYIIFFAESPIVINGISPVVLPRKSLSEIHSEMDEIRRKLAELESSLASLRPALPLLDEYGKEVSGQLDFAYAETTMLQNEGPIVRLGGYVPAILLDKLLNAAKEFGWAVAYRDPDPDDEQVPTYITKPAWLNIMDPLFDFIGVSPGYRENDVNLFFLIFFPVFFGMIIGDAVYGLIFLICAIIGKVVLRKKEGARLPLNLFILLSCCSVTWGILNGTWAGLPESVLPTWMHGVPVLTDPAHSEFAIFIARKVNLFPAGTSPDDYASAFKLASWNAKIIQWICFFLAGLHLSLARLFKFVTEIRHDWRAWGHLGWALLLTANFFMAVNLIVFPNTFPAYGYWMYGIGTALIVVTITFNDALNLPFALIGSFTDVLSYIRLYAVGLAGTLIGIKFNEMGMMLTQKQSGTALIFATIAMIIVALFGHILNIALGFLSVLVHAIRLNTLEFSNHMGMQWAGVLYKPFKKINSEKSQK